MNRQVITDLENQLQAASARIELTRTFMFAAIERMKKLNEANEYSESAIKDGEQCVDNFEAAKENHRKISKLLDKALLQYAGITS